MKKVFVVFKVARQVQGEYVMVQTLGVFNSSQTAEKFGKSQAKGTELVATPEGKVECHCEVGIHEAELK